jgi:hypothetical protein
MTACADCGDTTDRLSGLCPPCITARVDRDRTAQGLPLVPSPEFMERVARILRPAAATSRGAA